MIQITLKRVLLCHFIYRKSHHHLLELMSHNRDTQDTIALCAIVACVSRFALVTQTENQTVQSL